MRIAALAAFEPYSAFKAAMATRFVLTLTPILTPRITKWTWQNHCRLPPRFESF